MSFFGNEDVNVEEFNSFAGGSMVPRGVVPRWQRKANQKKAGGGGGASSSTDFSSSSSSSVASSSSSSASVSAVSSPCNIAKTPAKRKMSATSTPSKTPAKSPAACRFIPNRSAMDFDASEFNLTKENASPGSAHTRGGASSSSGGSSSAAGGEGPSEQYNSSLADTLFEGRQHTKVLAFAHKAPVPKTGSSNSNLRVLYTQNKLGAKTSSRKCHRSIAQAPERILDAPDLVDDYYLNLLDWSSNNILSVALHNTVYLWNAESGTVEQLAQGDESDAQVTSVSWVQQGNYLSVGLNNGDVQLWDTEAGKLLRTMRGHMGRVSSLAWNDHLLSSGSRDSMIFNHDVRIAQHHVGTLESHQQEVCGLKWSADGSQLASGGNDNMLCIWDASTCVSGVTTAPRFAMHEHQAAVKALAWCPWQSNLLASGGGTADRTLRFWNTSTGACVNHIDTKSQVCSILWNPHDKELVTSHGYSQNQLTVWKYPSLVKMAELTGHTSRVLHMAMSPDGTQVVSAAADETLRFWRLFEAPMSKTKGSHSRSSSALFSGMGTIR